MKSEAEIRAAWEAYQSKAHPEDRMSYVEFLSETRLIEYAQMGIQLENNWFGEEDEWYK